MKIVDAQNAAEILALRLKMPVRQMVAIFEEIPAVGTKDEIAPDWNPREEEDPYSGYFSCPICYEYVEVETARNFCPNCGQKLNWKKWERELYEQID